MRKEESCTDIRRKHVNRDDAFIKSWTSSCISQSYSNMICPLHPSSTSMKSQLQLPPPLPLAYRQPASASDRRDRNSNSVVSIQQSSSSSSGNAKWKTRRKNAHDINRERKNRARKPAPRPPLIALWNSLILAESENYEFLDGRFLFPPESVRWDRLEKNGQSKHFNPVGKAQLYDIVLRSQSWKVAKAGRLIVRSKGAVMKFEDLRGGWKTMEGYTSFWKGVKLMHKPDGFRESIAPGMRMKRPVEDIVDNDVTDGLEMESARLHLNLFNDWNGDHDYDDISHQS